MADTGAPWNIPFVEPTDLVRDYPAADEAQALAVAAGLSAAGNAGIGSNVVTHRRDVAFAFNTGTFIDVPDFSVTILPTSSSSTVFVVWTAGSVFLRDNRRPEFIILRQIGAGTFEEVFFATSNEVANIDNVGHIAGSFVDNPNTTSAVTYKLQARRLGSNPSTVSHGDTTSSITAIEVAA